MTKLILLITSIFIGLFAAVNGWMFLASVCGLMFFLICVLYLLKAIQDEPLIEDPTESFWHEEINQN